MKNRTLKTMTGRVISDAVDKTITVSVSRTAPHPLYKRVVRREKKYKAHDEKNTAKAGDKVKIGMTRPLSKTKRWRLIEVLR